MNKFISRFAPGIAGVLSGFDRLVFRGTLRRIRYLQGMLGYLWEQQVLLKDFGEHVRQTSERIKNACLQVAQQQDRPIQYLYSSQISKEEIARKIAAQDQVREGLVCVLSCVEPCMSYEVRRHGEARSWS